MNRVLKKENGVVTEYQVESYANEENQSIYLKELFEKKPPKEKKSYITKNQIIVANFIQNLNQRDVIKEDIIKMYKELKKATTKEEFLKAPQTLATRYRVYKGISYYSTPKDKIIYGRFVHAMEQNNNLIASLVAKKIVTIYYLYKIFALPEKELNAIKKLMLKNKPIEEILSRLDENFTEKEKNSTIYEWSKVASTQLIDYIYNYSQIHLCWEYCDKIIKLDCPKIGDIDKEEIDKYDFIKDGYQVYDEKGDLTQFVVTNCDLYQILKGHTKKTTSNKRGSIPRKVLSMGTFVRNNNTSE